MRNLRNDESGAMNWLMIVLLLVIVILVASLFFGILMTIIGAILIAVGLMAVVQAFPPLKGPYGVVIGLIFVIVGFAILL